MPDDETDLTDVIDEAARGPAKASNASGSAEQHKLTDLIEADKYQRARRAGASNPFAAVKTAKIIPPAATS